MTIPNNKMQRIAELREPGDAATIAKITGLAQSTVFLVLRTGTCSPKVAQSVIQFYKVRERERKAIQKLIDQDQD